MIQSPEVQSRLAQLRQKSLTNEITLDEMKEAIRLMRADRHAALDAQKRSKASTSKAPARSADDLLKSLF